MITPEERETHIHYDYPNKVVKIFTTEQHVYLNFIKRLGKKNIISSNENIKTSIYELILDEKVMRKPYLIAPLIKGKNVS